MNTPAPQKSAIGPFDVDLQDMLQKAPVWDNFMAKVDALPKTIRGVLFSYDTTNHIIVTVSAFNLTSDQAAELSRIVRDILLGELYIGSMPEVIAQRLGVDTRIAREIASRVMTEIFKPALDDIKKVQLERFRDQIGGGAQQPQQDTPAQEVTKTESDPQNLINLRKQTDQYNEQQ